MCKEKDNTIKMKDDCKQKFDIITLPQTNSTQTYIIEADKKNPLSEYSVVYTDNQVAGRGQGTHSWESEMGKDICFSLVLTPKTISVSEQFFITQIISLAVVDTLVEYGLKDVKIKWPNDIYVKEKKICGMLVQNNIIGNQIVKTFIGIGINVNQSIFHFAPNPTSIFLERGKQNDLRKVLNDTLQHIFIRYQQLNDNQTKTIQDEYLSLLLFKNSWRNYIYNDKYIYAQILTTNSFGHLILQTDDNEIITAELRELKFVF